MALACTATPTPTPTKSFDVIQTSWVATRTASDVQKKIAATLNAPVLTTTYSAQEIAYFYEIVFGREFLPRRASIIKWRSDVRIKVHGTPTDADLSTLVQVVAELNDLVTGVSLSMAGNNANVDIHFAPETQFSEIKPNYTRMGDGLPHYGFGLIQWKKSSGISNASILISSDGITQTERSHLIREELTQILGLTGDSYLYPDSIFQEGWTDTIEYAPIDRAIIRLLYEPILRHGMTQRRIEDILDAR
jgi:hypothetical protein